MEKKIKINIIAGQHQEVVLEIINTGPPIAQDILPRIFDPYFSTHPEGKGVGLGLYIAKTLVEKNMGGKLHAQNRPQGVCFVIALPTYSEVDAAA